MERERAKFTARGAKILAIAVQSQAAALDTMRTTGGLGFPVLADVDRTASSRYNVLNLQSGLAVPSVFIVNKNGSIRWTYISRDEFDRPSSQTVLNNLP